MKKLAILQTMFALMLFTFSACSEDTTDGPRQFEVIEADLIQEFSGEAETRFVPVNFDGTFTYKMSDSDWCTAKRTGNGNVVTGINITVTENPSASPRTATITLIASDAENVVIKVEQKGSIPSISILEPVGGSVSVSRAGGEGKVKIKINSNFAVKFEPSKWITLFSSDSQTGEYRFSVEAFDTQSPDPRFGEILILPESDEIVWTDMTKISVQQMGQLPDAPKAPETLPGLATAKADFSDISFTANGYVNAAPAGAMPVKEGESGIPSTVWSEVTNSYVLSLGTPDYWIPTGDEILDPNGYGFDETGGLNQKYLAVMYDGPVNPNRKAEFAGRGLPFLMETYLKVTNAAEAAASEAGKSDNCIYLTASRDRHQNGNFHNKMGIGFRIDADQKIRFFASTGGQAFTEVVAQEVCPSDYVHILCTRSADNKLSLYINGVLQNETTLAGISTPWTNDPRTGALPQEGVGLGGGYIGIYPGLHRCMEGEIAFFRWDNKSLTAEEVQARYANVQAHSGAASPFAQIPENLEWLQSVVGNTADDLQVGMSWAIENGEMLLRSFDASAESVDAWLQYVAELQAFYNKYYRN